ncbi:MAG: RHS repeat-associated core domain-containing protein [Ruminococcaceae bacterium]|nr:RHS repeat-associated core domain-containing protein [Oscillospiraceae bacterium]
MEYEYDNYHNVTKAITQKEDASGNIVDGTVYEFAYDTYGNNTLVKVVNGNMYISSSATYTPDGNRLHTTKDGLENTTTYCYNENTGVLEWVQYPNDTETSRTTYTYDEMYRIKTALATVPGLSEGTALTASYTYDGDLLTAIQTGSTTYSFTYGAFSQRTGVSIGDRTLASYIYTDDANRYLSELVYGNGWCVEYYYDDQGRLSSELRDSEYSISYEYDNTGALSTMTDSATGRKTTYYYDLIDRLGKYREVGPNYEHSVTYTYDERNNLSGLVETINGVEHTTSYTYDYENRLTKTNYDVVYEEVRYDSFGRIDTATATDNGEPMLTSWFSYVENGTPYVTTPQVVYLDVFTMYGYSIDYAYEYDDNGNISYYSSQGSIPRDDPYYDTLKRMRRSYYHYDTANQLVREDNEWLGKTFVWAYDNAGNITSRKEYAYTNPNSEVSGTPTATYAYTYGDDSWGDLLTAYNGIPRTYDEIGNLLTDGTWSYTWQNGRELASMTDGETTWSYTYDANGMRTSRSNGTKTYNYVYNGSQLTQMTVGNDTLYFTYGILGPNTVTWNGTTYYYALNAQGDVTGIFDWSGHQVVTYNWDTAWGYNPVPEGPLASTLGTLNPLRYRSYVYDTETGYYYLQSRYYDPEIGRFINADVFTSTGQGLTGTNMFAYCGNNPVSRKDDGGEFWHLVVGGVIGGIIGAISSAASGGDIVDVLIGAAAGAAGGVLAASGAGVVVQALGSAAISMASNAASQVNHIVQDKTGETEFDVGDMLFDGAVGLACGAWGGNGASYGNSGGIMAAGKQLFKRGFFNPQARSYYAKVAHNMGGEYVFKPLLQSLGKSAVGSTIVTGKNILVN